MANICDMSIVFFVEGDDYAGLTALKEMIEKTIKSEKGRFGGILSEEEYPNLLMEGQFTDVDEIENGRLWTKAETDWIPMYEFLEQLSKVYGVNYASSSSEPGFDIFEIYGDKEEEFFTHHYLVDVWGADSDIEDAPELKDAYEFFDTKQEMLEWLEKEYGPVFHSEFVDEWQEFFDEYGAGRICKWRRVERG